MPNGDFERILKAAKDYHVAETNLKLKYEDNEREIFFITNKWGLVRYANLGFETLLGYERDKIVMLSWTLLMHPGDMLVTSVALGRMMLGAQVVHIPHIRIKARDGAFRWFRLTAAGWTPQGLAYNHAEPLGVTPDGHRSQARGNDEVAR